MHLIKLETENGIEFYLNTNSIKTIEQLKNKIKPTCHILLKDDTHYFVIGEVEELAMQINLSGL